MLLHNRQHKHGCDCRAEIPGRYSPDRVRESRVGDGKIAVCVGCCGREGGGIPAGKEGDEAAEGGDEPFPFHGPIDGVEGVTEIVFSAFLSGRRVMQRGWVCGRG